MFETLNSFPELVTSDWLIRKFKLTDLDLVKEASADKLIPLITSIPSVFSEVEGEAYIKRQWSRFNEGTGYSFAIADRSNDKAIGSIYIGLRNVEDGRASIGYWLVNSARGRGVAKAALAKVTEWVQSELNIPRLELYVEPWNTASVKTAEAAGFQQEGLMRSWQKVGNERKDMIIMSLIFQ